MNAKINVVWCIPMLHQIVSHLFATASPAGAQVPITSYVCTLLRSHSDPDAGRCNVTNGFRTCKTEGGVRPILLNGRTTGTNEVHAWSIGANPFMVLDIPQGWCVGSVEMTFVTSSSIPTLSLSVHSAERLSNHTDRTMFSSHNVSGQKITIVVMNLTNLTCGRYLRINMTSVGTLGLTEIAVFDTGRCTH